MTITITIDNRDISGGKLTGLCQAYLKLKRLLGAGKVHWEETK